MINDLSQATKLNSRGALGIGARRSLRNAAQLKVWAEDTQKLVDYIKANFTPYERYSLKVYTGHSVANPIPGFISPNHGRVDIAYMDWRFVQDQASCGNAILKGQWLVPNSSLRYMEVINFSERAQSFASGVRHWRGGDADPGDLCGGRPEDAGVTKARDQGLVSTTPSPFGVCRPRGGGTYVQAVCSDRS